MSENGACVRARVRVVAAAAAAASMPPHPFRSSKVTKINSVTPKRAAHTWDSENKKNKNNTPYEVHKKGAGESFRSKAKVKAVKKI